MIDSINKSPFDDFNSSVSYSTLQSAGTLIYGTGSMAREVLDVLDYHNISVIGFVDHLTNNIEMNGKCVFAPDKYPLSKREQVNVIIAIHNRVAQIKQIIENLRYLGYSRIITLIDLYDYFGSELGSRYWLAPRKYLSGYVNEIRFTRGLFADEVSVMLFDSLIEFRKTGDYSVLSDPDLKFQYCPRDLPSWTLPIRMVDCGAFDGDTVRTFATSGMSIEALAAFEPDPTNFQELVGFVNECPIKESFLWPCGVYSSARQIYFTAGNGEASVISEVGATTIQCVSLDEAIPGFNPTLIKMDIEGAEVEALKGAQRIIMKYKPGLAISVYHLPRHIFEIPLLISNMMPNIYNYYLRAHGYNDFDVVLYAMPK